MSALEQAPHCEYPATQRAGSPLPQRQEGRKGSSSLIAALAPLFTVQPDSRKGRRGEP